MRSRSPATVGVGRAAGVATGRLAGALAVGLLVICCGGSKAVRNEPALPTLAPPAPKAEAAPAERAVTPAPEGVDRVLDEARAHLGKNTVRVGGKNFRYDCSGFVRGMYSALGVDVMSEPGDEDDNGVRLIHKYVARHGENHTRKLPQRGDIIFFDNTWDKNGNGKLDDPLTHVGLVEDVREDGTVLVIHRANRGIVRDPMNLLRPHDMKDEAGRELNAWLRPKGRKEPAGIPHTLAELWAGFGTVAAPRAVSGAEYLQPRTFASEGCGCEDELP